MYDRSYTLCLKKVHPSYFCDYSVSVKCRPILTVFGNIAAENICKQMFANVLSCNIEIAAEMKCEISETFEMSFRSCKISSLCMNIIEWKNEKYSVCFQYCRFLLPSCQFLADFSKVCSVSTLHSPQPLFKNSVISCRSIISQKVQMYYQNLTFVAKTHVYTKPLT